MSDKGPWVRTFTGRTLSVLDPSEADIDVRDVAHSLAQQCRYTGHTKHFYSVAEHCVLLARSSHGYCLELLMHDAAEAYLGDVPRPVKALFKNYAATEDVLMRVISAKYGFVWPPPQLVTRLDDAILNDEMPQCFENGEELVDAAAPRLGVKLGFWSPQLAEAAFLAEFHELTGGKWK